MADSLLSLFGQVVQRFRDMGDGTWAKVVAPTGDVASGATDSGNPIKIGAVYRAAAGAFTDGQRTEARSDARGNIRVTIYGADGNSGAGSLTGGADAQSGSTTGIIASTFNRIFNGSTWDRAVKPNSTSRLLSAAASTNATSVKASAGNVHRIRGENTNAAKRYLKLYNKATAPTVGTDTPVLTFVLQATAPFDIELGMLGHYFSAGIAYAITTAAADSDTGALTAGDVACLNIIYS